MVVRDANRTAQRRARRQIARIEEAAQAWVPYIEAWQQFEPKPITDYVKGRKGAVDFQDLEGSTIELAQQAETPRNGFVVPKTYSLIELVRKIDELPVGGHIDMVSAMYSVLPTKEQMPAHARKDPRFNQDPSREARGDNFMRRGSTFALWANKEDGYVRASMTADDLARIVNGVHVNAPQKLIAETLDRFAARNFDPFYARRGMSWHPYSGNIKRIVSDVDLIKAYQWAGALINARLPVRVMAENGTPVVYIPSRHEPGMLYDVRLANVPIGEQGYVDWNILLHETLSKQAIHAPKTTGSKYEQEVFNFHQIAGFLYRGGRDTASKLVNGKTETEDLPRVSVLPFPAPSEAKLEFHRKLTNQVYQIELGVTEKRGHLSIEHDHLNEAEKQALHSAWNALHGSAGFVYSPDSAFNRRYVRDGFERALAIK